MLTLIPKTDRYKASSADFILKTDRYELVVLTLILKTDRYKANRADVDPKRVIDIIIRPLVPQFAFQLRLITAEKKSKNWLKEVHVDSEKLN